MLLKNKGTSFLNNKEREAIMQFLKTILFIFFVLVIVVIGYFAVIYGRKLMYSMNYEFLVKETIREEVKAECLKAGQ